MTRRVLRLMLAVMGFACAASSALGQTRPLQIDDVVKLEGFGRASISPGGRWAVYEKRGAYDTTPRFDYGGRSTWAITDLWRVDLKDPARRPRRLLPAEPVGLLRGAWSPSGRYMLVYRFGRGRYEVGIASPDDRSVRWSGLTPEIPLTGASAEWITDDEIALTVRPDGSLPAIVRYYGGSQARAAEAWERTATGREASRTIVEARAGVARTETPDPLQALVVLNIATGQTRTIAEGRIADFAVSPDGRKVAVVKGGERMAVRADVLDQAESPTRQRLVFADLKTGAVASPLEGFDVAPYLLRWSPESRRLLVWARRDGQAWTEGALMQVGEADASVIPSTGLTPGGGGDILRGVRADWLDGVPVLYARADSTQRFDWYALRDGDAPKPLTTTLTAPPSRLAATGKKALHMFADGALWAVNLTGVRRTSPRGAKVSEVVIGDIDRAFRLKFNEAPRQDLVLALAADGASLVLGGSRRVRKIAAGNLRSRPLAMSPDAVLFLDRSELVETLTLKTSEGVRNLDTVNAGLADVVLSKPRSIEHLDAFGRPTQSWLFLPPGAEDASTKGLIVQVYPGSVDTGEWYGPQTLTYGLRAVTLAGAGYAVLTPSIPIGEGGTTDLDFYVRSVDAAVDAALAAQPNLPRDRIAVQGHSFGGYTALAIATRTDRYRSYIASSGMSDWFGEWGEFVPATRLMPEDGLMIMNQQGYVETGQGELSAKPWEGAQAYVDHSPYLAADKITAPVLLITADRDFIPMSQSERMFSALYRLGGTTRLLTYWGEHHHLLSPANMRDLHAEVFAWLDRTLAPPVTVSPDATAGAPTP